MKFLEKKKNLYVALQKLLHDEKVFVIRKLNRKLLASMLGTNEKYLHDALKEYTGLPFSECILSFRLNHACQLLANPNNDLTVEKIAYQSGFDSRKTFYRQFRKHYNTSPAQFRNMTRE